MSRYIDAYEYEKRIKPYDTEDKMDKALYNFAHNVLICCSSADVKTTVYGEWVSVKEKLPKDGVDVLAYLESGEYVIRHIVEVFGYKEWSGGQIGERTHNVIAWQPLPAPYKESEEEEWDIDPQ